MKKIFNSIAANRVNQALELNQKLYFAAGSFLAILDTRTGNVSTLKGHSDTVTCIRVVRCGMGEYVVSGSSDKSLIIWKDDRLHCRISNHEAGIIALGSSTEVLDELMFVSSDSMNNIKIFKLIEEKVECIQTITTTHTQMALALATLPDSKDLMLFTGGTDCKLHCYLFQSPTFTLWQSITGHTDWIKSISITRYLGLSPENQKSGFTKQDLVIATASQDKYIRIWKISVGNNVQVPQMDDFELNTKAYLFECGSVEYSILLDAVLMGHDDWVFTVNWHPLKLYGDVYDQPLVLISSSADKTIICWYPDIHSESWMPRDVVGEVGGTTYGFYGALLSEDGQYLYANGYHGSIHIWKRDSTNSHWQPVVGVSGHSASVEDCKWDPTGTFLLSTSLDQTSRIFSYFKTDTGITWHEIARAQIHGYDLHSCAFTKKYQYVSAADEKVLRVFDAPKTFTQTLMNLAQIVESEDVLRERPVAANLPALGLSNKAVFEGESAPATLDSRLTESAVLGIQNAATMALTQPPFEENLLQNTLWPETAKLYGHGYEVIKVASNEQGTLVASSSKATKAEHATIRLWDTNSWTQVGLLEHHQLTVTTLVFSNCGKYLLSAGRDRVWAIFDLNNLDDAKLLTSRPKAHARIIWTADFTHDDRFFVTGSRDKTAKIWTFAGELVQTLTFEYSVTVAKFYYSLVDNEYWYLLGVGLENGDIEVMFLQCDGKQAINVRKTMKVPTDLSHAKSVKSLVWRPRCDKFMFATCSEDHSVNIFQILP